MKLRKILQKTQRELKNALYSEWRGFGYDVVKGDGYIYKDGTFPVLLVAHMDTVHKKPPREIIVKDGIMSSPTGIGGDDRCGIYMIEQIIKRYDCSVLLTEDEEIGCVGADKFAKSELASELKDRFCYIIELDRRGKNDAVFYDLDNIYFEEFITEKHWKTNFGTCSDISVIAPVLNCAAVNLSCGYYNEHTLVETINLKEMKTNIDEVCKLLCRTDIETVWEWKEIEWTTYRTNYGAIDFYIEFIDESGEPNFDCVLADSEYEAIGIFMADHPTLTYNHISDIDDYTRTWERGNKYGYLK